MSREATTFGDAGDQLFETRRLEFADGDVVQQEEGLGADAREVVDQHRDEVDADRVVAPDLTSDVQLRADAVGRGDQHRRRVLRRVEGEEPAESADAAQHLRARFVLATMALIRSTAASPASIDTPAAA